MIDRLPKKLSPVPRDQWPRSERPPAQLWASKKYLVQIYDEADGVIRITVSLVKRTAGGNWKDGICWDELQRIKSAVGYADYWAVEIYPHESETVHVANMRHLWVLPEAPAFAWRRR